jgi:multiple sugar transport system substrate-binding protein
MKMKGWFVGIALSLFAGIVFSGCSALGPKVPVTVSYWGDAKEIAIIEGIVAAWSKKHPGIKVILQHTPSGRYQDKIISQIVGGEAPDVMFCGTGVFVNLYKRNVLMPLNSLLSNDTDFNLQEFYPAIAEYFTVDNTVYAIPRDIAPIACVYVNKNLFQEAGLDLPTDNWTTDDVVRLAKQLTRRDANGIVSQYGFSSGWFWMNWLFTFGGSQVDDIKKPTRLMFSSPGSKKGLEFYHDLMWKHQVSPKPGATDQTGADLFMTGRVAMYASGIWEAPQFRTITAFDWDVVMFPKSPTGRRGYLGGGAGYGIYSGTKHVKEAWEVLKCLSGDDGQIQMAEAGLAQPAKMSLARGPAFMQDGKMPLNKKMLDEATKFCVWDPFSQSMYEIMNGVVYPSLDLYFQNQKSLDEVLTKIEREVKEKKLNLSE